VHLVQSDTDVCTCEEVWIVCECHPRLCNRHLVACQCHLMAWFRTETLNRSPPCNLPPNRSKIQIGTVVLPYYRWQLATAKPIPGYPENLDRLGDHIRKVRLDRGLNRKAAAAQLQIDAVSLKNWEEARTEIEVRFYPRILAWLGYDPMPKPMTRGEQVRIARMSRGWSRKRLAHAATRWCDPDRAESQRHA
jgi:hypothetical protein